jgi:hypothetical protein
MPLDTMTLDVLTADAAGWIAAMLTACCFASTRMLRLRALALMANLAFIAYGSLAGLLPVLALHLMLAPLNAWHLARQWRSTRVALGAGRSLPAPSLPPSFNATPARRRPASAQGVVAPAGTRTPTRRRRPAPAIAQELNSPG